MNAALFMVSPIHSPSRRHCPALGHEILTRRCVAERVLEIDCPIDCAFNPFNPEAPQAFDAIVGRGLSGLVRWLEKTVGQDEWTRRFDEVDRRFLPERDLPLISYETQWQLLHRAAQGLAYPEVAAALKSREDSGLRSDARLLARKLAQSRAMLVQVIDADDGLPYYKVKNVFAPSEVYLYVDFGDQEPLEEGAIMFGRFLIHEKSIYVIPGVFVGSPSVLEALLEAILEFLDESLETVEDALQMTLPEIWNVCASVQDEHDELASGVTSARAPLEDPFVATLSLDEDPQDAADALRRHDLFVEVGETSVGFKSSEAELFEVYVKPEVQVLPQSVEDEEDDEEEEAVMGRVDEPVRVGAVCVRDGSIEISAVNPIEMELLKSLIRQLVSCS